MGTLLFRMQIMKPLRPQYREKGIRARIQAVSPFFLS